MGAGQVPHFAIGVEIETQQLDEIQSSGPHPRAVEDAASAQFAAEEQILFDGEVRNQAEFLEHRADAEQPRGVRRQVNDRLALIGKGAFVGRIGPGDNVDERRFARAVLAEQDMNLAVTQFEIHLIQRGHARKPL